MFKIFGKNASQQKKNVKSLSLFVVMTLLMVFILSFGVFASPTTSTAVSSADLQPILDSATENIGVTIPVGVGLMAIVIGVSFIPLVIHMFRKGR